MAKIVVIKDGIVDNNYIRVICEEEHDYDHNLFFYNSINPTS